MPRHHDLNTHLGRARHDRIKIVYLEPQQDTVSVRLVIEITNRTVIVFYSEAVQLKNKLAIENQLLIFRAPMIALAAQQTLIPATDLFHIGYSNERLRTHPDQNNNSIAAPSDLRMNWEPRREQRSILPGTPPATDPW